MSVLMSELTALVFYLFMLSSITSHCRQLLLLLRTVPWQDCNLHNTLTTVLIFGSLFLTHTFVFTFQSQREFVSFWKSWKIIQMNLKWNGSVCSFFKIFHDILGLFPNFTKDSRIEGLFLFIRVKSLLFWTRLELHCKTLLQNFPWRTEVDGGMF